MTNNRNTERWRKILRIGLIVGVWLVGVTRAEAVQESKGQDGEEVLCLDVRGRGDLNGGKVSLEQEAEPKSEDTVRVSEQKKDSSGKDDEYDGRYGWPLQRIPRRVIVCELPDQWAEAMLLESLSGLAAQAVNEERFDALVWIRDPNSRSYARHFEAVLDRLDISDTMTMGVWELADYLKKERVVKGYVLYRKDGWSGPLYTRRDDIDLSANVATVYAGILQGILVDETMESEVRRHGFRLLKDARYETPEQCFVLNKALLNNGSALSIDPLVTNCRDIAIAQRLMLYYDTGDLAEQVLEWVRPLSPILGWNCGDEDEYTGAITRWGHYNTATNWCRNLPLLSAGAEKGVPARACEVDPKTIDFTDTADFHAYVMSDGDNMQWTIGAFVDDPRYLGNPARDSVGLSWTTCPVNLSVMAPSVWKDIAALQKSNFSLIEYGGGYQYPDQFAINRPNREELLRAFARRLDYHFHRLGITVFGFICKDVDSPEAQQAFKIYAEEIEGLTGMLAVQYYPYELEGATYWFPNRDGIDIPVSTARYSLWNDVDPNRPRCGTPEYVSSLINRDVIADDGPDQQQLSWTIVHAWSDFGLTSPLCEGLGAGFGPVKVSEDLLLPQIKTVSASELLWRIRMKYRPEQTCKILGIAE